MNVHMSCNIYLNSPLYKIIIPSSFSQFRLSPALALALRLFSKTIVILMLLLVYGLLVCQACLVSWLGYAFPVFDRILILILTLPFLLVLRNLSSRAIRVLVHFALW